jgi:uncharacterized protein YlxP (DUF503 family)
MIYKEFELTEWERLPGKWRVAVARTDGTTVKSQHAEVSAFVNSADMPTVEESMQEAKSLIDKGIIR